MKNKMSFSNYRSFLSILLDGGYSFLTHRLFMERRKDDLPEKTVLLRHDVDLDNQMRNTLHLVELEKKAGVTSTVFIRLHDPEYNTLGFREMNTIQRIIEAGCEIGLHCETIDLSSALEGKFDPIELLKKDIAILELAAGVKISGVSPHGDLTENNNQDVLTDLNLSEMGLSYHAYQKSSGIFSGWYISNYFGNNWKRYIDGTLMEMGEYDFLDYADMAVEQKISKVTFLVHPRPWHEIHYLVE